MEINLTELAKVNSLRRHLQNSPDDVDESNGSPELYELVIWMFASFLLVVIIVMWVCYWWVGYRLRRVQGSSGDMKARHSTIGTSHDDAYDAENYDGDSIGSRPKVVVVQQRSQASVSPTAVLGAVAVNSALPADQDCMTAQTPATKASRQSLGSLGSYFREMRWAAWKLGINKERMAPASNQSRKLDPPGTCRIEFSTGIPEGLEDSSADSYLNGREHNDEYGLGSYASSQGGDSLYTTP